MKKIFSGFLFTALAVMLPVSVSAEVEFSLECEDITLERGQSTTCEYIATQDAVDPATLTEIVIDIEAGEGLTIEGFTPANVWKDAEPTSQPSDGKSYGITLESTSSSGIADKRFVVGEVLVQLAEDATECGSLCIAVTSYIQGGQNFTGKSETDACEDFEIEGENPDTGAFASYTVLAAGALIAIGAITVVKNKNKFYRI